MQNIQKWISLSFLGVGVSCWLLLRYLVEMIISFASWRPQEEWLVSPQDWVGIVLGLVVFIFLRRSHKASEYLAEVFGELSKVSWPKTKESALSTVVVVIMVAIASLIFFFFDSIWGTVVGFLYK